MVADNDVEDADDQVEVIEGDEEDPIVCIVQRLLLAPRLHTISQRNAIFRINEMPFFESAVRSTKKFVR